MIKLQRTYGLMKEELECVSSIKRHILQPLQFEDANQFIHQRLPTTDEEERLVIYEYCHRNIEQIFLLTNHWESIRLQTDFVIFKINYQLEKLSHMFDQIEPGTQRGRFYVENLKVRTNTR